jgi:hypothetical protein
MMRDRVHREQCATALRRRDFQCCSRQQYGMTQTSLFQAYRAVL